MPGTLWLAANGCHGGKWVLTRPDGSGTVSLAVQPYGEGKKLLLSQDITERERNDAMRRDFVANVSHEIRTPLTVLTGFLETMRNLRLSDAERERVQALMAQQAERMQTLVADLLTLIAHKKLGFDLQRPLEGTTMLEVRHG